VKPKENTIIKIDLIFEKIYVTKSLEDILESENLITLKALQAHIHSMNLHKAKVAYFSNVKSRLNFLLELLSSSRKDEIDSAVRELKKFL
jgi:hypothetical protein